MSMAETAIFDVLQVIAGPIDTNGDYRWQRIRILTADGLEHTVVAHLHPLGNGIDPTPRNRVDDIPRQPALIPE